MLLLPCQDRELLRSQSLTDDYKLGAHENCVYDVWRMRTLFVNLLSTFRLLGYRALVKSAVAFE